MMAQAIRAVLLASATLAIFGGLVANSLANQGCLAWSLRVMRITRRSTYNEESLKVPV